MEHFLLLILLAVSVCPAFERMSIPQGDRGGGAVFSRLEGLECLPGNQPSCRWGFARDSLVRR